MLFHRRVTVEVFRTTFPLFVTGESRIACTGDQIKLCAVCPANWGGVYQRRAPIGSQALSRMAQTDDDGRSRGLLQDLEAL